MKDKLIIAALVLSIGFYGGWTVNNWRNSKVKADLAICQGNTKVLMESLQSQNRKMAELVAESEARIEASKTALEDAQSEIERLKQSSESIANRTGETCEDAEKLINEALGL